MDTVRILRIIEYVGPRDKVEAIINHSIHGTQIFGEYPNSTRISVATIGTFPEILEKKQEEKVK